jgi:hypothetical protein
MSGKFLFYVAFCLVSIILFVWDHATDAAAWVVDITGIAGDDMDVAVHRALAGGYWDRPAPTAGKITWTIRSPTRS